MKTAQYNAIRVDDECNADDFWWNLRERYPELAASLSNNGAALVSDWLLESLTNMGAFKEYDDGPLTPLIDCGTEGPMFADVVAGKHSVFDMQNAAFAQPQGQPCS